MESTPNDIEPRIRPDSPPIVVTTAGSERYKAMRVGQAVAQVVADELADHDAGRAHAIRRGEDPDEFDRSEDDRAVWEGNRLRAVIRPRAGGDPEVIRLEETGAAPKPEAGPAAGTLSEDDFDARSLPWDVTDRAIGRWREALRERDLAYRAAGDHAELEKWTGLTTAALIDAERSLISAVLAWSPEFRGHRTCRPTKYLWPSRGVLSCGKLYLAIPDPNRDGGEGGGNVDVMQLAVVEMSSVVDMDDCPDVAPLEDPDTKGTAARVVEARP